MHGKMIVLIPNGEEHTVDDFHDEIMYGIGAGYIGDRIHRM